MANITPDHARPAKPESQPKTPAGNQAHKRRTFFNLNDRGERVASVVRKGALIAAVGLAARAISAPGAPAHSAPSPEPSFRPIPTLEETAKPSQAPEAKIVENAEWVTSDMRVGDINPNHPPTESYNGEIMVKIDLNQDAPKVRENMGVDNSPGSDNSIAWEQIQQINGVDITQAVNSGGKTEIVFKNSLMTGNAYNPDTGRYDGLWMAFVIQRQGSSTLEVAYLSASESTRSYVMLGQPQDNKSMFSPVSPDAKANTFGQVSLQPAPSSTGGTD